MAVCLGDTQQIGDDGNRQRLGKGGDQVGLAPGQRLEVVGQALAQPRNLLAQGPHVLEGEGGVDHGPNAGVIGGFDLQHRALLDGVERLEPGLGRG